MYRHRKYRVDSTQVGALASGALGHEEEFVAAVDLFVARGQGPPRLPFADPFNKTLLVVQDVGALRDIYRRLRVGRHGAEEVDDRFCEIRVQDVGFSTGAF